MVGKSIDIIGGYQMGGDIERPKAVEKCASCFLCKFTRNSKKANVFYKIGRHIQSTCPVCGEANKTYSTDLQKSKFIA